VSIVRGRKDGEKVDVPKHLRVTDETELRSRAMAYFRQRLDGRTDSEIGRYWGRCRQYINEQINGLSEDAKRQVRRERLRSIKADELLREAELADAC
jgi:predicted transcriptional regulator